MSDNPNSFFRMSKHIWNVFLKNALKPRSLTTLLDVWSDTFSYYIVILKLFINNLSFSKYKAALQSNPMHDLISRIYEKINVFFYPHHWGCDKGLSIRWGSSPTTFPDSRTDEDSRQSTTAIWHPSDRLHGHQQWDLHYTVKLRFRRQPHYYVNVKGLMLIHTTAQIWD